tara:strand:+ start:448 stop:705 length:258 start_codon:yes stop_codon:yes gene_type:complete
MALSEKYLKKAKAALASAKDSGSTTMSPDLMWDTISEVGGQQPAFQLAKKFHDKFPKRFKKGGKVKKAKCRDGIARKGKTKGTIR